MEMIFNQVNGKPNMEEIVLDGKRVGALFVVPANRDGVAGIFYRVRVKAEWNETHETEFREMREARAWLEVKLNKRFGIEKAEGEKDIWGGIPEVEEGRPKTGQLTSNKDHEQGMKNNFAEVRGPRF
jgi:hypothetical protein